MTLFQPHPQDLAAIQLPQHPVPYRQMTQISIGVQTDLRETAIQTDPWTAELNEKSVGADTQNVRDLIELTVANGLLPAHQETMVVIDRINKQKEFNASIPKPLDPTKKPSEQDLQQEEKRMQMLMEKDIQEWSRREHDLAKQHTLRVRLLVDELAKREQVRADLKAELLDRLTVTKQKELADNSLKLTQNAILQLKKTQSQLQDTIHNEQQFHNQNCVSDRLVVKTYRGEPTLTLPQQGTTKELVKQTIYSANPLNAPVLKPGEAPYRFAGVIRLAGTELKTEQDFNEILEFQQANQINEDLVKPHKPVSKSERNYSVKEEDGYLPPRLKPGNILQPPDTRADWMKKKTKIVTSEQVMQKTQQITQQEQRAQVWKQFELPPPIHNQKVDDAALYLQNLIRGRATERKLEQGKNRRLGLVHELRLAHNLVQTRSEDKNLQKIAEDRIRFIKESLASGVVAQGVSSILGQAVDQLEKDRIRQQQIMRAEAILQIAIRERQRREQLESTQREKEVMHRSKRDFQREQIHDAHCEFVNMVIDQISQQSAKDDAVKQAQDLALRQVESLVELDYQNSKQGAGNGYQDQLQDYLGQFLLPEVDRQYQLVKMQKAQQQWFSAGLVGKEGAAVAEKKIQKQETVSSVGKTRVDKQGIISVNGEAQTEIFKGVDKELEKK